MKRRFALISCPEEEGMKLPPCAVQALGRWLPGADLTEVNVRILGFHARLVKRSRRAGIAIGKTIFFGEGYYDPFSPKGLALIAHELKHVEQYGKEGTIGFLLRYIWQWAALGFKYGKEIPFEEESFEFEDRVREHLQREFSANGHRGPCLGDKEGNAPANADYQELPLAI